MSDDELDGLELTQWVELAETQLVDAEAADDADAIKSTLPLLHNCIERSTALYGAGSSRTCDHRVRLAGALQMIGQLDDAVEQLRACVAASVAAKATTAFTSPFCSKIAAKQLRCAWSSGSASHCARCALEKSIATR